ncbi:transcriptional regulator [Serinicoccus hydrothermalis]|uniref:Transcriptional regulator n=1 Tax=Serinicoccus hydrothermalis TaxID=1758689 RepID=A0A1B1NBU8_9MICO|nr:helix-turn-helix transcriptional regulator [Serinicoccus hydrothermalis]ANS78920.1 transcriptional regulator [Serinicoccus hydrothermalis]
MNPTPPARLHGSAYEEFVSAVFRRAVRFGAPTRELFRDEGLTDAEIDDATMELEARGFLRAGEEADTWVVMPPREAVARHAEVTEHRLRLARATAGELERAWRRSAVDSAPERLPGMDLLAGIDDVVGRITAMHLATTDRLWWALDGSVASRRLLELAAEDPDLLSVREGVERRLILDTSLLELPSAGAVMEAALREGAAVRTGNGVPVSAVVCDDDMALIDISRFEPDGIGSFETRVAAPVAAVANLVERTWMLAAPVKPMREAAERKEAGGSSAPLDERDHAILVLLASGASDQVIARRHGISVRTVERRVRYMMEHLGSATRFHAGAQAVRRGWV